MFSDSMKPDTRWWTGPASPQCGRSTKVWKPLFLEDGTRAKLGMGSGLSHYMCSMGNEGPLCHPTH